MVKGNTNGILFIYNENINQWIDNSNTKPGGGNSVLREYRYDSNLNKLKDSWLRSLGIPTGPGWNKFDSKIKKFIDIAIQQIEIELKKNNYNQLWWSASHNGILGTSIFKVDEYIKIYITCKLIELCKKINGDLWKDNFNYYPINTLYTL